MPGASRLERRRAGPVFHAPADDAFFFETAPCSPGIIAALATDAMGQCMPTRAQTASQRRQHRADADGASRRDQAESATSTTEQGTMVTGRGTGAARRARAIAAGSALYVAAAGGAHAEASGAAARRSEGRGG
ncbi:hypothetical protein F3J13_29260, partial [Burkholderia sp. Tr-849]|nr:hypothetical protein [Burkholderia sp. Tr-849]